MEKKTLYFYVFMFSLLAYELVNRPLIQLENDGEMASIQYQVLYQVMFGTLIFSFIGVIELWRMAERERKDTTK